MASGFGRRVAGVGGPLFAVPPHRVRFLKSPDEYLETLKQLTAASKKRVFLSGLYLGSDSLSKDLISAGARALEQNPSLSYQMLFDRGRGTRPEGPEGETSVSVCSPVLSRGARLHLWESPRAVPLLRQLLGARLSELLGVFHGKVHVMDEHVVLSGANLSKSYFSNRKDRYVVIEDARLADWWHEMLEKIAADAWEVGSEGKSSTARRKGHVLREAREWAATNEEQQHVGSAADDAEMVWVRPALQFGGVGLRQDEAMTREVGQWAAEKGGRLAVASGYLNVTRRMEELLWKVGRVGKVEVLVASPLSNSWAGSKGASRRVPAGYAELAAQFAARRPRDSNVKIREWHRESWSFHVKGMWYWDEEVAATIVGSGNYGYRSAELDLETQVLMWCGSQSHFRQLMDEEMHQLEENLETWTVEKAAEPVRHLPYTWKAILPLIKRFM